MSWLFEERRTSPKLPQGFSAYQPKFENPYPDDWDRVTGFEFPQHLYFARAREALIAGEDREAHYLVYAEYKWTVEVDGDRRSFIVPSGMLTDLVSVPWFARWLVGRVGRHLEAAIVHDFLFIAWQDLPDGQPRLRDFHFANAVMWEAMRRSGVAGWKRDLIYLAISLGGWGVYKRANASPRYVRIPEPEEPLETAERDAAAEGLV